MGAALERLVPLPREHAALSPFSRSVRLEPANPRRGFWTPPCLVAFGHLSHFGRTHLRRLMRGAHSEQLNAQQRYPWACGAGDFRPCAQQSVASRSVEEARMP